MMSQAKFAGGGGDGGQQTETEVVDLTQDHRWFDRAVRRSIKTQKEDQVIQVRYQYTYNRRNRRHLFLASSSADRERTKRERERERESLQCATEREIESNQFETVSYRMVLLCVFVVFLV